MDTQTIQLHRVLRATPDRVYRAFLDPDAMVKWLPPNGFTGKVHAMDARVGGGHRMSFTNFSTGRSHSFGGKYLELVTNERLCYTDAFATPTNLVGQRILLDLRKSQARAVNVQRHAIRALEHLQLLELDQRHDEVVLLSTVN